MELLIYLAQASLYGLLMWAIYCWVWKGKPWHTGSRIYLLTSAVLPLILPFIHLQMNSAATYSISQSEVLISTVNSTGSKASVSLSGVTLLAYAFIIIIIASCYVAAYIRLLRKLRQGNSISLTGYNVITHTGIGPGTIGTRIFFPEAADSAILRHEIAHIRAGHRFDAMLVQLLHIFFWPSPALWLIGRELKTVHEFEADADAIKDADVASYIALLLSQAFGASQINIAQLFFHHPLKRRILMLQEQKRSHTAKRTLFFSMMLTAALCGGVLFAQTVNKQMPDVKPADLPKPDSTAFRGNAAFLPDGRFIYTSVNQLHKWPKKFKKGAKDGC